MKKYLLFIIGFVMVSIGAMAYNTNGEFNSFGVKCIEDNDNLVQKIVLQEAGDFADFVANGNFNQYFNSSKWKKVVFEGPMNEADFNAVKFGWNTSDWSKGNFFYCTIVDFTNVNTDVAPLLKSNEGNESFIPLIIWPKAISPTNDQLVQIYNNTLNSDNSGSSYSTFAYYLDNNEDILYIPSQNVGSPKFAINLEDLATLVTNGYHSYDAIDFAYTWDGNGYQYYKVYGNENSGPSFFSTLAKMPLKSINFQGLNLSSLGHDFSNLNNASTHYIILPINNASGYVEATDFTKDTYPSNIYVVAAHAGASPYGAGGDMGGQNYNIVNDTHVSSITLTYVAQHGKLAGGAPYLPSVMQNADKMVMCGQIDANDLLAIDHMTCAHIDLSEVTLTENVDISTFVNETTQYLALPNNTRKEDVDKVYKNCSGYALKCVGAIVNTELAEVQAEGDSKGYQAVPANTLITYSKEQGCVEPVQYMVKSLTDNRASNVNNIIMSGYLNAADICNSISGTANVGQESLLMGSDGHLYAQGNLPEGVTDASADHIEGTLFGASLSMVDFTNAIFDQPSESDLTPLENCNRYFSPDEKKNLVTDMNFVSLAIVPSTKLLLPTDASQKVIPAYFMSAVDNDHCVESICIPYNFQYIMDYAFNGCGHQLAHIYTSKGAGDSDLVDGVVDHGYTRDAQGKIDWSTYTISSNVKYIAVGAFDTNTDAPVGDVYVLAKEAPICEKDAFCSNKYYGNNGFKNVTPVCRENYVNGNSWIAVLHFPNALNDDAKKKYTDIDRRYFLQDQTGAVDGDGNPIVWPIHSEFMRSWHQALTGYTWNDWSTNRCMVEGDGRYGEIFAVGGEAADIPTTDGTIEVENSTWEWQGRVVNSYEADGTTTTYDNQRADCEKCGFESYIGWHQFLLARSDYFYEHKDENYVQTPWYTFCVPYNMTKDELKRFLGGNDTQMPEVRTLVAAKRHTYKNYIDLIISQDLVSNNKDIKLTPGVTNQSLNRTCMGYEYVDINTSKVTANDVYVKGGYPYFVRGWIPEKEYQANGFPRNLATYVLAKANYRTSDLGLVTNVSTKEQTMYNGGSLNGYISTPLFNHTVNAIAVDKVVDESTGEVSYVENFYDNANRPITAPMKKGIYNYNFVGNFDLTVENVVSGNYSMDVLSKYIPADTYYMTRFKKDDGSWDAILYRAITKKYAWNPYICIISHNGVPTLTSKVISGVNTYYAKYDNILKDYVWGADEFNTDNPGDSEDPNNAKYALYFEEDYPDVDNSIVDGVRNINSAETTVSDNKIYSISGQYQGTSTKGLKKGIYVVNGKKVIID